jgi:predicted nucleic acid-binding protein
VATYFLDTSAIAKRYLPELGSGWIVSLTDVAARNTCWLAAVTRVELVAGLYRRQRLGHLTPTDAQRAAAIALHECASSFRGLVIDAVVLDRAAIVVAAHGLRAYDGIQLAAALRLRDEYDRSRLPPPIFVSSDQVLNDAARAEGMDVDDPLQHP